MFLLTWHGTLIGQPDLNGALRHAPLAGGDLTQALDIDVPGPSHRASLRHAELGMLRVAPAPTPGTISLLRDGLYLCAVGTTGHAAFDRQAPASWESFLVLSHQNAAGLDFILRHRWIVQESRQLIPLRHIALQDGFKLRIGPFAVDLATAMSTLVVQWRESAAVALRVTDGAAEVVLVVAEPRSSALVHTELWPTRTRRVAEILSFAVHRHLAGQEPLQADFERDVAFLLARQGAPGLEDLLERMTDAPKSAVIEVLDVAREPLIEAGSAVAVANEPAVPDAIDDVMMGWAMREAAPWQFRPVRRADADQVFSELNETRGWISVFQFAGGKVMVKPKPQHLPVPDLLHERIARYLRFFRSLLPLLPPDFSTTLCMGMGDALPGAFDVPMFCFQKETGKNTLLLPDVDFLNHDFYTKPDQVDHRAYFEKVPGAVFAGSTTGGAITPAIAKALSIPRLRAASYFVGNPKVDFRLPSILQCTTLEAEALLRTHVFCQQPGLDLQEQLGRRMLISMDGNGAACSRLVLALRSNSVLLKYDSDHLLYYFGGMQPWVHYVPIAKDSDVVHVVDMEARDPDRFAQIAANGRIFAESYLTAGCARRYTAKLLQLYEEAYTDTAAPLRKMAAISDPALLPQGDAGVMLAHIQGHGDRTAPLGRWLGEKGSTLAIEGLALSLPATYPVGFGYQVLLANGVLSDIANNGAYRGTRGESLPVYGLRITLEGDFADSYSIDLEASFTDGELAGPVPAGTLCVSPTRAPLESFRIVISLKM